MALIALAPPLQAGSYGELVQGHAETRLLDLARARGWVNFQPAVTAWVPAAADRLTCAQSVTAAPAQESARAWGRIPYVIRCADPSWEIRARAEVSVTVPVVIARRNLARGEALDHASLALAERDLGKIHGDFVTDVRQLTGQRARRALRSGQIVTLSHAEAPLVVERGEQVIIRVRAAGVQASMTGEALEGGSQGQGIRVRNHSSGKTVTAWVIEPGIVETRF